MAPKAAPKSDYVEPYRIPGDLDFEKLEVGDIVRIEKYPSYRVPGASKYKVLITELSRYKIVGFDMLTQKNVDIGYHGSEMELFLESRMSDKSGKKK